MSDKNDVSEKRLTCEVPSTRELLAALARLAGPEEGRVVVQAQEAKGWVDWERLGYSYIICEDYSKQWNVREDKVIWWWKGKEKGLDKALTANLMISNRWTELKDDRNVVYFLRHENKKPDQQDLWPLQKRVENGDKHAKLFLERD
jgi:hypothetical protein